MTKSKGDQGKRKRTALTREDLKRGLVTGGTVTLATLGCSSCNDNGAVDPPPPPLVCGEVVAGQTLHAEGWKSGSELRVEIRNGSVSSWVGAIAVTDLEGLILLHADAPNGGTVYLQFELASDTTSTGRFTISGELKLTNDEVCTVTRRFTVTIRGQIVEVADADASLPLGKRNAARIELIKQEGLQVLLHPLDARPEWRLVWSVMEGSLDQGQEGVLWTLPSKPGFYQVELLTDHGDKGFGLDTLAVEVS